MQALQRGFPNLKTKAFAPAQQHIVGPKHDCNSGHDFDEIRSKALVQSEPPLLLYNRSEPIPHAAVHAISIGEHHLKAPSQEVHGICDSLTGCASHTATCSEIPRVRALLAWGYWAQLFEGFIDKIVDADIRGHANESGDHAAEKHTNTFFASGVGQDMPDPTVGRLADAALDCEAS